MTKNKFLIIGLLVLPSISIAESMPDADMVSEWVSFLASDELQGRANGTPSIREASEWIAGHFADAGLAHAPGAESYFQEYMPEKKIPYRNVIGYLSGSDPSLANEYIVLSAHYDHIGVDGLKIFNGADDNASGTSTVVGLAYRLAKLKPGRSILFIAWSGEEEGLLGLRHYTTQPMLPLEDAVLNLNFEMVGHTEGKGKHQFWVTGAEHSTLFPALRKMGDEVGWKVAPNPFTDLQLFWRSDNASFVQLQVNEATRTIYGVPAHSISTWGKEGHYHAPSDTADTLDYENLAALIEVMGDMVYRLANQPDTIDWKDNPNFHLRHYDEKQ